MPDGPPNEQPRTVQCRRHEHRRGRWFRELDWVIDGIPKKTCGGESRSDVAARPSGVPARRSHAQGAQRGHADIRLRVGDRREWRSARLSVPWPTCGARPPRLGSRGRSTREDWPPSLETSFWQDAAHEGRSPAGHRRGRAADGTAPSCCRGGFETRPSLVTGRRLHFHPLMWPFRVMVILTASPHTPFDKRERLCYSPRMKPSTPAHVSPSRIRPDPLRFRPYTFHRRLKRGLSSGTRSYDVRQFGAIWDNNFG